MKPTKLIWALTGAAALIAAAPMLPAEDKPAAPPTEEKKVDPQALEMLQRAVDYLAAAKQYSVTAELWTDVPLNEEHTAQFTKVLDIKLRRPDRVQVNVKTAVPKRSFYYDGKNLTVADHAKGTYGVFATPPTIDETLTKAEEVYGVVFPIDDILLSKPFGNGAEHAKSGQYLGAGPVLGTLCHHVAFQSEGVDWQVWIQDGPRPLVRKAMMVSTDPEDAGRITVNFKDWDLATKLPDFVFSFIPPADAMKIDVLPIEVPAANEAKSEKPAK